MAVTAGFPDMSLHEIALVQFIPTKMKKRRQIWRKLETNLPSYWQKRKSCLRELLPLR
ncbi:hypothetical protein [Fontibacillus panacisegetis]|uniref:hypothetical protein n=1 Tax=Fontibacillus panacisegetis TaxID=670482 RepID=UPI001FE00B49|nr:hypothetical protein [Fontibacillus panacisegetis]